ncbi:hypothetical protein OQA88_4293 [Cercophora sp. LCS_1]
MAETKSLEALGKESRFAEIVIILSVFSVISTLAVGLRCYARRCILRCFGRDDGVMVAAQVLTIASAVAIGIGMLAPLFPFPSSLLAPSSELKQQVEAHYGLGRHSVTVPPSNTIPYMKAFFASIVVYNIAVCLTKISILLQYKRLFANPIMQRLTLFGLIFLTAWAVALAFLLTLICQPVAAFWDPSVGGKCLDAPTIWYIMAGVNLVTDFLILTLPMPVIKSLQLGRRQKAIPCAVSIYRIRTLGFAITTHDPMYDNVDAATWSFLELTTGVLAACLPTLRPIFIKIMPGIFGASSSGNRSLPTNRSEVRMPRLKYGFSVMGYESEGSAKAGSTETVGRGRRERGGVGYSVSVGADLESGGDWLGERGIKTTTVVTQKIESGKGRR